MKALFALVALALLTACTPDFFGTIPGRHWRLTVAHPDSSVSSNDVVKIADRVATKLGLAIIWVDPRSKIIELSDSPKVGALRITIVSDSEGSMLALTTDCAQRKGSAFDLQKEEARVISALKELYPHSEGAPFVAYRGLLGP